MRVLMTSFAMDAHFAGSVPLAWALRAAGHEVQVASQPALTGTITAAGLTAVPVGVDHDHDAVLREAGPSIFALHQNKDYLENNHERLEPDFLTGHITVMTALFYSRINSDSMIDDLVEYARYWQPDLVVWEPFTFAGAVAALASGAAHARLLSFPDMFLNARKLFLEGLRNRRSPNDDDPMADWLGPVLARFGCEFGEEAVTGQWSVDQMPVGVRLSLGNRLVPMRYVPYNGLVPAVVPGWLRSAPARPRVCVTLGVTAQRSGFPHTVPLEDLFAAVRDLDVEIVATMSAAELAQVPDVPENVRLVESVPLDVLLPTCSAIVHHGGAGTWATAAALGVPQVAMGWMWDHLYRAQRLEALGAGLHLPTDELTPTGLRDRLVRLLEEPGFRKNAESLSASMRSEPSPAAVVPVLERLTERHRPVRGTGARLRPRVPAL
ncbi:activator-dependent family glycosyltransferase [Streptomyces sp. Li-HN-5-11]|uniref:activator-dependent family glycosyltransferase n=1 Tax=Streptomyces sp. Li-HN-5-11 TaxID=3075432 RepID=UPI0028ADE71C|nr:activator-dependent family glycosyltransferase [Streptomyces sp. Li-HN-5-11]WNM31351.1 activator-dependent family glycosyltransferase [Streptomyces sp. Li-HN-5-11]